MLNYSPPLHVCASCKALGWGAAPSLIGLSAPLMFFKGPRLRFGWEHQCGGAHGSLPFLPLQVPKGGAAAPPTTEVTKPPAVLQAQDRKPPVAYKTEIIGGVVVHTPISISQVSCGHCCIGVPWWRPQGWSRGDVSSLFLAGKVWEEEKQSRIAWCVPALAQHEALGEAVPGCAAGGCFALLVLESSAVPAMPSHSECINSCSQHLEHLCCVSR